MAAIGVETTNYSGILPEDDVPFRVACIILSLLWMITGHFFGNISFAYYRFIRAAEQACSNKTFDHEQRRVGIRPNFATRETLQTVPTIINSLSQNGTVDSSSTSASTRPSSATSRKISNVVKDIQVLQIHLSHEKYE